MQVALKLPVDCLSGAVCDTSSSVAFAGYDGWEIADKTVTTITGVTTAADCKADCIVDKKCSGY